MKYIDADKLIAEINKRLMDEGWGQRSALLLDDFFHFVLREDEVLAVCL